MEILDLKEEMKKVHVKLDFLVEAMTDLTGDIKNHKTEQAAINSALNRHEQKLDNHEHRIQKLENIG